MKAPRLLTHPNSSFLVSFSFSGIWGRCLSWLLMKGTRVFHGWRNSLQWKTCLLVCPMWLEYIPLIFCMSWRAQVCCYPASTLPPIVLWTCGDSTSTITAETMVFHKFFTSFSLEQLKRVGFFPKPSSIHFQIFIFLALPCIRFNSNN